MYGIVIRAIHGLVESKFGPAKWEEIKLKCGIQDEIFLSDEKYPDKYTYDLVASASEILDMNPNEILFAFGEYWIENTGKKTYGELFKASGTTIQEFLINLPNFHTRVSLIYPKIQAPEFVINETSKNNFSIEYYSQREGLEHFVLGLLSGIAKMFDKECDVKLISTKNSSEEPSLFEMIII